MRLLSEHMLREELHNELHARPSLYFKGDVDVWHVAVVDEGSPPLVSSTACHIASPWRPSTDRRCSLLLI